MLNKKIIVFVLLILVIGIAGLTIFLKNEFFKDNKQNVQDITIKNPDIKENVNDNADVENENEEKKPIEDNKNNTIKDDTTIDKKPVDNNQDKKPTNDNKNNNQTNSKEEQNNENKPIDNNQSINNNSENKPKEKIVCTSNNSAYKKWLDEFLRDYDSTRIFDSLSEAESFGEDAAQNYGYGYYYSPSAKKYENDECYKEYYTVNLYVSPKLCNDNPKFFVSREQKLIDVYRYLDNKGYSCPEKSWFW